MRQAVPLCLFWILWKTRNKIVLKDKIFSVQREKTSFVFLLWSETRKTVSDGPSTIVGFIDSAKLLL